VLWLEQACSVASGRSFAVRYRGETAKKISDRPLCSTPRGNSFAMNYSGPGQFGSRQIRSQASRMDSRYGVQLLYTPSRAPEPLLDVHVRGPERTERRVSSNPIILAIRNTLPDRTAPSVTNRSSIIRLCGNSLPYPKSS
jgi:hypothetical protein